VEKAQALAMMMMMMTTTAAATDQALAMMMMMTTTAAATDPAITFIFRFCHLKKTSQSKFIDIKITIFGDFQQFSANF
jgi:hypothetical protein